MLGTQHFVLKREVVLLFCMECTIAIFNSLSFVGRFVLFCSVLYRGFTVSALPGVIGR